MEVEDKKSFKKKKSRKPVKIQQDNEISFDNWFFLKSKSGTLKDYQKSEIKTFFRVKGLSDKEERSKYDETLKLY